MTPESPAPHTTPGTRLWVRLLITFILAFDIAAFIQWFDGAFQSEFGAHPDEGAHYVAGKFAPDLLRDAWAARNGQAPAEAEEGTTPASGIRQYAVPLHTVWPPGFALLQYAWGALFGHSRLSILLLLAALAAATATLLYRVVEEKFGDWAAAAAALLWLCAPLARSHYEMVMPAMLSALTMLGTVACWARFLDQGRARDSFSAAALATLAVLTSDAGPVIALLVAASCLFTGKWRIFARPATWPAIAMPVATVAALRIFRPPGVDAGENLPLPEIVTFHATEITFAAGIAVALFALASVCLFRPRSGGKNGAFVYFLVMVLGIFAWRCIAPAPPDSMQLVDALPALIFLAVAGAHSAARVLSRKDADERTLRRNAATWVLLLLLLALAPSLMVRRMKDWAGCGPLAEILLSASDGPRRVLVVSDPRIEGMWGAELAMRDSARRITVERGSETLADRGRRGADNRPEQRFLEDDQLTGHLTSGRLNYLVLDTSVPHETHANYQDQAARVAEIEVRRFWPLGDSPLVRDGEPQGHPLRLVRIMRGSEQPLR